MNEKSNALKQYGIKMKMNPVVKEMARIGYLFIKRAFDVLCGIVGVLLLIPLSVMVKIGMMVTGDFHPIFYQQKRIGKDGKTMIIYKYRTMVPNAEEELKELLKEEKFRREWEQHQKIKKDPRITKLGKFLRNTSIDEMPQFWNVLKGDMSLIGPRPLVEGELEKHKGDHTLYESVKPGLSRLVGMSKKKCCHV